MKNRKDIWLANLSLGNKISGRKSLVRVNTVQDDILDLGKFRSIGFSNSPDFSRSLKRVQVSTPLRSVFIISSFLVLYRLLSSVCRPAWRLPRRLHPLTIKVQKIIETGIWAAVRCAQSQFSSLLGVIQIIRNTQGGVVNKVWHELLLLFKLWF